jgi:hypothetical protein
LGKTAAECGIEMHGNGLAQAAEISDYRHCFLLRARRKRPRSCCAAQCEYEFSPSDVDCHATPPAGGRVHAIEGDDITL